MHGFPWGRNRGELLGKPGAEETMEVWEHEGSIWEGWSGMYGENNERDILMWRLYFGAREKLVPGKLTGIHKDDHI